MLARTLGYGLNGVNGFEVKVEVYLSYHERMKSQSYGRKFIEIITNSQG